MDISLKTRQLLTFMVSFDLSNPLMFRRSLTSAGLAYPTVLSPSWIKNHQISADSALPPTNYQSNSP
ncbi:hypothetical protein EGR_09257 [Echinococcus granulosus]|uniref:Uncharacterized protein n=1 Tax=Echinococcus granulosus TaxID=6210 RepID=W6U463_ECHGR|nr:hypothetical protein EGR_09253 [Echinococcus granulosus]XP_024347096.1 hypothetical protein EGR_09257 [Echinococcus granulosus]EUB55896.1 hypothetical protein EGR_09253 [Echinococcus granulosus]EUB55900.1 hypothetical protein EGR_09257 [Echinococcus granulosus]